MQISTMMFLPLVLYILSLWERTNSQSCPSYKRFTQLHSFCLPTNPTCQFITRGLTNNDEIELILKLHNDYRSKIAMGKEQLAGGMPKASNMLQMEWDPELAAVAQKWAENCVYEHDCRECRQVENFPVGQNIAYSEFWCEYDNCVTDDNEEKRAWEEIIKNFYDEIADFDNRDVTNFQHRPVEIGHFTQMIWATTWRIGCGYVFFKIGEGKKHYYVCNYGPSGNIYGRPIYKPGLPCSDCPVNSCCGDTCEDKSKFYPGLCKMQNPESAPVYPQKAKGLIFGCDFYSGNQDCRYTVSGATNWETKSTLIGLILSIELKGGEESQLHFKTLIRPKEEFCLRIQFRKGPSVSGTRDMSLFSVTFTPKNSKPITLDLNMSNTIIAPYSLDLSGFKDTGFILKFSVPLGAPPHILDIKDVVAFNGICKSKKTDEEMGYQ